MPPPLNRLKSRQLFQLASLRVNGCLTSVIGRTRESFSVFRRVSSRDTYEDETKAFHLAC
jgi:hypothetical protein